MTSPSIFKHNGLLYLTFIGWNDSPSKVSEVWVLGATSTDDGYTWSNFQVVETKIGMEGQVTKAPDGSFYSVYTSDYKKMRAFLFLVLTILLLDGQQKKNLFY